MYESFFQFEKPPFRVVPDPSMLFTSRSVREAMSRLDFAVRTGKGIVVMTGEVGTGKTTLVNRFLDRAGPDTQTAYIFNPTLSGLQLLKTLADELGVQTYGMAKVDLTRAVYELLLRNRQAGKRTIVFVDEAQALSREALEELRLISNLETWQEKLLHIVLVGQPELLDKLESFNMRQLRQRVELFIQIEPMSAAETRQYIEHRLRIANPLREVVFDDPACQRIHALSGGIPRTINIVCDASLLVAFVAETGQVTAARVREAARTIDAQEINLRERRTRRPGHWRRLWGGAAAAAALFGLLATIDSSSRHAGAGRTEPTRTAHPGAAGSESGVEVAAAGETTPPRSLVMVHLASFRDRGEAEEFARSRANLGRPVYLQTDAVGGWVRVLVGDFTAVGAADRFAADLLGEGRVSYARPVQVTTIGLEPWPQEATP